MNLAGYDNPLSPNGPDGATWSRVEELCDESIAVESYQRTDDGIAITWCDGNVSVCTAPQEALIEIREMSLC